MSEKTKVVIDSEEQQGGTTTLSKKRQLDIDHTEVNTNDNGLFWQQIYALCLKNALLFKRIIFSIILRVYIIPIAIIAFVAFSVYIYAGSDNYGVGIPRPIQNLTSAVGSLDIAYFSSSSDGLTDTMKNIMADALSGIPSVQIHALDDPDDIFTICKENQQGSSRCYGAVQWNGIDIDNNVYNYTLRSSSGQKSVKIKSHYSDTGKYVLPLQWAVDRAIANLSGAAGLNISGESPLSLEYTTSSEHDRIKDYNARYTAIVRQWFPAAIFLGMIGLVYQLAGDIASERESGMVSLLSTMGVPQITRLISFHVSYSLLYIISWIVTAAIYCAVAFKDSSVAIAIIFYMIYGLSLTSYSLFLGNLFPSARLAGLLSAGISVILAVSVTIAIRAESDPYNQSSTIYVLSALFPPCNFAYFIVTMASWQVKSIGANIVESAPNSSLYLIVFFAFAVMHIFIYFGLAAWYERVLYKVGNQARTSQIYDTANVLEIRNLCKVYSGRTALGRRKDPVVAVDNVSLSMSKDQIISLLGANGSGKTTILELIAGRQPATSGDIAFAKRTKFGICPQINILWDNLTVREHIKIWGRLKGGIPRNQLNNVTMGLIEKCDLTMKTDTLSSGLSGGQKRKLQLAIMFVGGTEICLIDEVSSGLDPISRRKIWDILLDHRKDHLQILTTHFLDEADILSDRIAIVSKGVLQTEGTSVELKNSLGVGYKLYFDQSGLGQESLVEIASPKEVIETANKLEADGIAYRVTSPTLDDVLLKYAARDHDNVPWDELTESSAQLAATMNENIDDTTGLWVQTITMLRKRFSIMRNNPWPEIVLIFLPIIVAAVCNTFYNDFVVEGCVSAVNAKPPKSYTISVDHVAVVQGPQSSIESNNAGVYAFTDNVLGQLSVQGVSAESTNQSSIVSFIENRTTFVDTKDSFQEFFKRNYNKVYPGGLYLQDSPLMAYCLDTTDGGAATGTTVLNYLDNVLLNGSVTIVTNYAPFQKPFSNALGDMLQFVLYFGLSICAASGFMTLYVTYERTSKVRAMEYSNGLRSLPLWLAYVTFYFLLWIVISLVLFGMLYGSNSGIISAGFLILIFLLYGLTSTLVSYTISLFAESQLSAYAITVAYQAGVMLIYLIAVLCELTYGNPQHIPQVQQVINYTMSILGPSAPLMRSLFIAYNLFGLTCTVKGDSLSSSGSISAFGQPILYLILQALILATFLAWYESGKYRLRVNVWRLIHRKKRTGFSDNVTDEDMVQSSLGTESVKEEVARIDETPESFHDGLLVSHLDKSFGEYHACKDVSFGVEKGECFALLGPNGAGKTTVFNMIRGEIIPDSGEAFINGISIVSNKSEARARLGVCPQFDAMDQLTVTQNLKFYGRLRQLKNLDAHVERLISAVGIARFKQRKAHKLSGGNKRKLSLAIALICNPHVLLLDEPSSGMDVLAKRIMWKTLAAISQGRSIVLTTHSMEEADALSNRAGFLARHFLAVGTSEDLRKLHGQFYHAHLVCGPPSKATDEHMIGIVRWIQEKFPGSRIDDKPCQGQVRISIPVGERTTIASLFTFFEENKHDLYIQEYSVSPTRLEEVFLEIVGAHNVTEEGYHA